MVGLSKDEIKARVLTDNTAQGILKQLKNLQSSRARLQKRWIWELLQNARDASVRDNTHLVASVKLSENELVFQHNGRGFTVEEVAHLIYHGSTKLEDPETLGKYGSGFLTTHLLSSTIDVSGQLEDRMPFSFPLKREISSPKALSESMDRAWNAFDASAGEVSDSFTTRFRYPLNDDAVGPVEEGIRTLKQCAPFVVAFNSQFHSINIESSEGNMSFEVLERLSLKEELVKVTVRISEDNSLTDKEFLLSTGGQVDVAIPMETRADGLRCLRIEDVPRLFLGFPLVGTETFSFPAVINSFTFYPTEDRDGIYISSGEDEANRTNESLLGEARVLHLKLIEYVAQSRWMGTHTLADIPAITDPPWLSTSWLRGFHQELISRIHQISIPLAGGGLGVLAESIFPFSNEAARVGSLWDLLNGIEAFQARLPQRSEVTGWCSAIGSWAAIMDQEASSFDEVYDGTVLASYVEEKANDGDYGTIGKLEEILQEGIDPVKWLNQFHHFLKEDEAHDVIQEFAIVLGQNGHLDRLQELHRDMGVAEELKVIAEVLGLGVLGSLRDTRLTSIADEVGKGDLDNGKVIHQITDKLQELSNETSLRGEFIQASPRLFAWLTANQEPLLPGFPAFSTSSTAEAPQRLQLDKRENDDPEMPLAPVAAWREGLQEYESLFPARHILSDDFFTAMPDPDAWQSLNEYVRTDVVIRKKEIVGDFLHERLEEDKDHKTAQAVAVADVAYLSKDQIGVLSRVRDSQRRARLFWRFLTEWLANHDLEGLESKTVECECGLDHALFPAQWLGPIVRNSWVPLGKNVRDRATAETLATLLRDSWTPKPPSEDFHTDKLLAAMQITRLDLMRNFVVTDDESRSKLDETMTSILLSTGGDLSHVQTYAEDLKNDPALSTMVDDRRKRLKIIEDNQRLGASVEALVKDGLEDQGFKVCRTGIGSDFEIEHDIVEGEEEIGLEVSKGKRTWLVEVKATREYRVRMTTKQAETAVCKGDGFLLCVVPVEDNGALLDKADIRANMRFIQGIGPRVQPLCENLDTLNEIREETIGEANGDIQLEINGGTARIRVDNAAWQNGIHLAELSTHLSGQLVDSEDATSQP